MKRRPGAKVTGGPAAGAGRGAFTLVELMIVVAIMGLVVGIGIPAIFRAAEKDALRATVTAMMEACQAARAQAILSGQTQTLMLRPRERAFEAPGKGSFVVPQNVGIDALEVNFVDVREFDHAPVRFYPNGTSDEFTVVFSSARHEQRFIELDCITALPRLENEQTTRYRR
ncbi:MAG: prepilin-type N-terminal cleavage/methylation domain-containing protein [Verrucomicrobiae bacterium]|nr:prepilin-type N-terminal cleavage/methylation domain-containing protein [Verrucomicrobiae bacterium]